MFSTKARLLLVTTFLSLRTAVAAVEVNTATLAELDSVKGLGLANSQLIVGERRNGSFKNWADFQQRLNGLKDQKAAALSQAGLTVNGEPFNSANPANAGQPPQQRSSGNPSAPMPMPMPMTSNMPPARSY